jgi:hypothetical protein
MDMMTSFRIPSRAALLAAVLVPRVQTEANRLVTSLDAPSDLLLRRAPLHRRAGTVTTRASGFLIVTTYSYYQSTLEQINGKSMF